MVSRIVEKIPDLITRTEAIIILSVICILLLIWGIYSKIKFLCLEKASEMVAKVEKQTELSGEEKFALCILWINEELPNIFRNNLFKSIISKLVDFAYNTSFDYMRNYIKRKTGYDIGELVEHVKDSIEEDKEENKEDSKEDD